MGSLTNKIQPKRGMNGSFFFSHSGIFWIILAGFLIVSCKQDKTTDDKFKIGFVEAFEDPTLEDAKRGFFEGLKQGGYSVEKGNIEVIEKNAQGDFAALVQAIDNLSISGVDLLATSASITTITAVKKIKETPLFMMVAPEPGLAGLLDLSGKSPKNLYGVYERLAYIDTSFHLIKEVMPDIKVLGISYNPSESQSTAAFEHMKNLAADAGLKLESVAISNSSETAQAITALTEKGVEAFFAMPDNTIFASFELIIKICHSKMIPVFSSESGLVNRGAVCAYGADLFLWGKQSGGLAAKFLSGERSQDSLLQEVKVRNRVFNRKTAERFPKLSIPAGYRPCEHE